MSFDPLNTYQCLWPTESELNRYEPYPVASGCHIVLYLDCLDSEEPIHFEIESIPIQEISQSTFVTIASNSMSGHILPTFKTNVIRILGGPGDEKKLLRVLGAPFEPSITIKWSDEENAKA